MVTELDILDIEFERLPSLKVTELGAYRVRIFYRVRVNYRVSQKKSFLAGKFE